MKTYRFIYTNGIFIEIIVIAKNKKKASKAIIKQMDSRYIDLHSFTKEYVEKNLDVLSEGVIHFECIADSLKGHFEN